MENDKVGEIAKFWTAARLREPICLCIHENTGELRAVYPNNLPIEDAKKSGLRRELNSDGWHRIVCNTNVILD
jgi:hypothetical protein